MYTIIETRNSQSINHAETAPVLFNSKAAARRYAKQLNKYFGTTVYRVGKA